MRSNASEYHRRSIRLKGYDYTQAGAYFVTICTQNGQCLFGEIDGGKMHVNDAGRMIQRVWDELPQHYAGVAVDTFVVMPNHIHGIITLVGVGPRAYPEADGQPQGVARTMSLPDFVHRFKSLTTARYRHGVRQDGWQAFPGRLWQRNYYEHIIRDEDELNEIRRYIEYNPLKWELDRENPRHRS